MFIILSFTIRTFHNSLIYRLNFWVEILNSIIIMYGVYWLWIALYSQNDTLLNVELSQMITYSMLGVIFELIYGLHIGLYISKQCKLGAITNDVLKPIGFHFHMLARDLGETLFRLISLAIPSFILAFIFFDIILPQSLLYFLLFLISSILGYFVLFHLNFLIGLLSLYTLDVTGIDWAYGALSRLLGGQFLPLWMFTGLLSIFSYALPFRAIYYIPFSIYIGSIDKYEIISALTFQTIWLVILFVISRVVLKKSYQNMCVQGG